MGARPKTHSLQKRERSEKNLIAPKRVSNKKKKVKHPQRLEKKTLTKEGKRDYPREKEACST